VHQVGFSLHDYIEMKDQQNIKKCISLYGKSWGPHHF